MHQLDHMINASSIQDVMELRAWENSLITKQSSI